MSGDRNSERDATVLHPDGENSRGRLLWTDKKFMAVGLLPTDEGFAWLVNRLTALTVAVE